MVRSIRHALLTWVSNFEVDFYDPPSFPALINLHSFAFAHFPATDLSAKIDEKLNLFVKSDENFESNSGALLLPFTWHEGIHRSSVLIFLN